MLQLFETLLLCCCRNITQIYSAVSGGGDSRDMLMQAGFQLGALLIVLLVAIIGGIITGMLLLFFFSTLHRENFLLLKCPEKCLKL